jgi:hypothetical protein
LARLDAGIIGSNSTRGMDIYVYVYSMFVLSYVGRGLFFGGGGCEAIGTAATPALVCHPRVIGTMMVEKQLECKLAGETEVLLGENLPQRHFCPSQNPT